MTDNRELVAACEVLLLHALAWGGAKRRRHERRAGLHQLAAVPLHATHAVLESGEFVERMVGARNDGPFDPHGPWALLPIVARNHDLSAVELQARLARLAADLIRTGTAYDARVRVILAERLAGLERERVSA